MANKWISHVQSYASKNGINYRDALKDPKCKAAYKKGPMSMKSSKKMRGGVNCDSICWESFGDDKAGYDRCYNSCANDTNGGKKSKRRRGGKKRKGTRKR